MTGMQRYPDYTRGRLAQTLSRLRALVHAEHRPLDSLWISPPVGRVGHAEAQTLSYRPSRASGAAAASTCAG